MLLKKAELPAIRKDSGDPYYSLLNMYELSGDAAAQPFDKPYLSALASVMYAAVFTREDVSYHLSFLARFSQRPFLEAWEALLLVLCYM